MVDFPLGRETIILHKPIWYNHSIITIDVGNNTHMVQLSFSRQIRSPHAAQKQTCYTS